MPVPRSVAFRWLVLGVIGCSGAGDPHDPCDPIGGPSVERARFGGIDYRVTGGLSGDGNGTSLHIEANGAVTRETLEHGTEQGRIDQATVDALVSKVRSAQFATLCSMYQCSGCADDFVDEVSVHLDDVTVTARASQLGDPPAGLQDLITALRQVIEGPLR